MRDTLDTLISSYYDHIISSEKELESQKYNFKYYIDSADLIKIIKGHNSYYENGYFNEDFYNSNSSVLYCLLMGGWIEEVNLLPLHQDEFLDKLNLNFGLNDKLNVAYEEEFISDIERINKIDFDVIRRLETKKECKEFVNSSITNSIEYFKLIYNLLKSNWKSRFKNIVESKIIKFNNYSAQEIVDLPSNKVFSIIKDSFDNDPYRKKFKDRTNNFNDALALTYISKTIKKKENLEIPILLDTTGTFSRIIHAAKLQKEFQYFNKVLGQHINLIREPSFFIFKSIFDPVTDKYEKIQQKLPKYYIASKDGNKISKIILGLEILQKENVISNTEFKDLSNDARTIIDDNRKEFIDYINNKFFQNVWLPSFADEETYQLISENIKGQDITYLERKEVEDEFINSFWETYNSLRQETKNFKLIAKIWTYLLKIKRDDTYDEVLKYQEKPLFAVLYYGVFRFSLLYNIHNTEDVQSFDKQISDVLFRKGFLSTNDVDKSIAVNKTISVLFNGIFKENLNDLSVGLAILWSLNKFIYIDSILKIYEKKKEYPHYSFALIHCASIYKRGALARDEVRVQEIIDCISNKVNRFENYKVQICVSYIYYLKWDKTYSKNFSRTKNHPPKSNDVKLGESLKLIDQALSFFESEIDEKQKLTSDTQSIFYLYALNMKIFITVECISSAEDFNNLEDTIHLFTHSRLSFQHLWQGRFDDTLSRYFLRKSVYYLESKKIDNFNRELNKSREYIDLALKNSVTDIDKKEAFRTIVEYFEEKDIEDLYSKYGKKKKL